MTHGPNLKSECELLDEEAFAAPERLSPDDCLDQIGQDWRWNATPFDPEDGL